MIIIEYCAGGDVISDFNYPSWITLIKEHLHDGLDHHFQVSTEIAILAMRVEIKKGTFSHKDIVFKFKGQEIRVDKYGNLDHWPIGFCDTSEGFLIQLLDWSKPCNNQSPS